MNERSIFLEALDKDDPSQRSAFLERACAGDQGLRRRVEALLRSHVEAGSFLGKLAPQRLAEELAIRPIDDEIQGATPADDKAVLDLGFLTSTDKPDVLGRLGDFRLLREIGRGGMGVVYEAQQLSLDRRVAVKVLPLAAALDSKQLQRFQLEAHAAACLHHTNIVPIHAVGCERGVPFYAMQLIEGRSLAQVIDELRQFEGLDHADRAGVGLANISTSTLAANLVSGRMVGGTDRPADGEAITFHDEHPTAAPASSSKPGTLTPRPGGEPCSRSSTRSREYVRTVAQFGVQVAEALDHAHTRGILHRDIKPGNLLLDDQGQLSVTDFGLAQIQGNPALTLTGDVLGTLRYMSPEQALAKRVVIDGRTDIYSLGVTIYELLTLRPAIGGQDRQEILRRIAQEEPPAPRMLNPAVPRDLETIVLKAMAKEPSGRYSTAKELADELGRFLEDRSILARRPGLFDRTAKWARRHRAAVQSVGVSMTVLLLMAVGGLATSNVLITRERNGKDRALKTAEANLQLARKAVDELYTQLWAEMCDLPQMQSLEPKFLEKVLKFYLVFAQQKSTDPGIRLGTAQAYRLVGQIRYKLGQQQLAEEALIHAVARLEELRAEDPSELQFRLELASAYQALGLALAETKGSQQAEQVHRRAIKLLDQLVAECPDRPDCRWSLAVTNNSLGTQLHARPQEAERAHLEAITLCEKLVAEFPERSQYRGELVRGHYTLGLMWAKTGQFPQAEKSFRDAIALFRQQAGLLNASYYRRLFPVAYLELAKVLHALGRIPDANDAYRESIGLLEQYVASFPRIAEYWDKLYDSYANLVRLLEQTRHSEEAASVCRHALDLYQRLLARLPDEIADQGVSRIASGLDAVLRNRSRAQDREQDFRQALDLTKKLAAQSRPLLGYRFHAAYWHNALGALLSATGRTQDAADAYREAIAYYRAAIELNPNHAPSLNNLARILSTVPDPRLQDPREALFLAQQVIKLTPTAANIWSTLGLARYRAGDFYGAITALEKSEELGHGSELGLNAFFLALAHWQLGGKSEARNWYEQAVHWMEKNRPKDDELRRFRAEAEEVMRIKDQTRPETT